MVNIYLCSTVSHRCPSPQNKLEIETLVYSPNTISEKESPTTPTIFKMRSASNLLWVLDLAPISTFNWEGPPLFLSTTDIYQRSRGPWWTTSGENWRKYCLHWITVSQLWRTKGNDPFILRQCLSSQWETKRPHPTGGLGLVLHYRYHINKERPLCIWGSGSLRFRQIIFMPWGFVKLSVTFGMKESRKNVGSQLMVVDCSSVYVTP